MKTKENSGKIFLLPTNTCFGMGCEISKPKLYEKIYKIKKRSSDKPLSVLVPNFEWLEKNTFLNKEQINFLKNYEKPFTIIAECDYLRIWINYVNEENNEEFFNRDIYDKFAFRIAHNDSQEKILKEVGPIFLTSANYSNNPEIYDYDELEIYFGNLLESGKMIFLGPKEHLEKNSPSEIFEFIGEGLEKNIIRK